MAKPKGITIKLTEKQRQQIKKATGQEYSEVKFEAMSPGRGVASALSSKSAPVRRMHPIDPLKRALPVARVPIATKRGALANTRTPIASKRGALANTRSALTTGRNPIGRE